MSIFFPNVQELGNQFVKNYESLFVNLNYSYFNILISNITSLIIGILIFILVVITNFTLLKKILSSLKNIPISTLYPISLLIVGIGRELSIFFLTMAMTFSLFSYLFRCYEAIPKEIIEASKVDGCNKYEQLRYIILPYMYSDLLYGFMVNMGIGFNFVLISEIVGNNKGIGYILNVSAMRGRISMVYLSIILIFIVSYLSDYIIRIIYNQLEKWRN